MILIFYLIGDRVAERIDKMRLRIRKIKELGHFAEYMGSNYFLYLRHTLLKAVMQGSYCRGVINACFMIR